MMDIEDTLQLFGTAVVAIALLHQYTDVKMMPVATAPSIRASGQRIRRNAGY